MTDHLKDPQAVSWGDLAHPLRLHRCRKGPDPRWRRRWSWFSVHTASPSCGNVDTTQVQVAEAMGVTQALCLAHRERRVGAQRGRHPRRVRQGARRHVESFCARRCFQRLTLTQRQGFYWTACESERSPRCRAHHPGDPALPPCRAASGTGAAPQRYRAYSVRDAVLLARVRRLTELGLSLDEVRDALADDAGRELAEVLEELDADLARQEAAIRERRRRLSALLAEPPGAAGPSHPPSPRCWPGPRGRTRRARPKDREYLTLMDATSSGSARDFRAARDLVADPGPRTVRAPRRARRAPADDPRIAPSPPT